MGRTTSSGIACLVLVLAAVTAGCGGGGKKKAEPATIASKTAASATTQQKAEQATATTTPSTTPPVNSASDISKLVSPGNCKEFGELSIRFANALGGAASAQDMKTEAQLLGTFADGTPSEIRSDFKYVADYFSRMAAAVGNVPQGRAPEAATIAKLQQLANELDQTRFEHVGDWLVEQCGSS